uniref:Reverse transcriptase Ty1/copia-type domain-containing protein n=1 Tax=Tanacetum cinerariifolium TaxID=118510 RepID=A0A6L2JPX7_TANCI|nr:hypothetical protein [Tanacetum cinerariifolium]
MANSDRADVCGFRTVKLKFTYGKVVTLQNVYHVPSIPKCLISVSKLDEHGFEITFESRKVVISKHGVFVRKGYFLGRMYRVIDSIGPVGMQKKVTREVIFTINIDDDPKTFSESMSSHDALVLKEAIDDEMDSILENQTWELAELPKGMRPIERGIDYFDTYAPVARTSSIRIRIAISAVKGLYIYQMDVKTTFLNGYLNEEVYMEQPEGFVIQGQENKVCRLVNSLYLLKQAPKQWHDRKFLRALPIKWRPNVTSIEKSKDLSTLPLDEFIDNLKVYEVVLEKDLETSRNKKEKYKSLALKARKVISEEEATSSDSNDEEYAMAVRDFNKFFRRRVKFVRQPHEDKRNFRKAKEDKKEKDDRRCFKCGDPNHFISDYSKHSFNDQKAFVVGCWSDSEDDSKKEEICLMALDGNEVRLKVKLEPYEWIKDSGFSRHTTGDKDLFSSYKTIDGGNVVFGGNTKSKIVEKELCNEFSKIMHDEFEMSMMGELNFFLGLQIKQLKDIIFFNQSKYVKEMLKKFGLEDSKPIKTPMASETKLTRVKDDEPIDDTKYHVMIGSLLYLTASRPDIMFSVCLCARFQEAPKTSHLEVVKRIFRYIKGTSHLRLWYPKGTGVETIFYSDSNHVGDYVNHKSTGGVCTFMGYCLTSWFSKKQTALAILITEAEYVSVEKACQQALWMKQDLLDYDINLDDIPVHCGNKGAIDLSKNPILYSRTKYIEICHHFLRDNIQKWNISIEKVSSEDNIADILTKPLKREPFNLLRLGLSLMEPNALKQLPVPLAFPSRSILQTEPVKPATLHNSCYQRSNKIPKDKKLKRTARISVRPCCFSNPRPIYPPYNHLSPPTDYQTAPPLTLNSSSPLSSGISPSKLLVTPKFTPPPLTSPPPDPTQPSKHSSPLAINIDPIELLFLTPHTSPQAIFDTLEDLPPTTTNPSPPRPSFDFIKHMANEPPPLPNTELPLPQLPPISSPPPPKLSNPTFTFSPLLPLGPNNPFPMLTHEMFCEHCQRTQVIVEKLRDEIRFILNHILDRLNVLSHHF